MINFAAWMDATWELSQNEWTTPLSAMWHAYADDDTFDLALHVLDELVHHGAEGGVLRDLYAHRVTRVERDASVNVGEQ